MRRSLLAAAVLTLALSACELRAEFVVNEDGSGTVGMVFAVEPEMLQLLNDPGFGGGGDPFADMRADLADDPVEWKVEDFAEGRLKGIHATFSFSTVGDLLDKIAALDSDAGGDTAVEDFSIVRRGGGWAFHGRTTDPQNVSGDEIPIPVEQLAALLKLQIRVTLPGKAASHNADEVTSGDGKTTFVWKPDLRSPPAELRASTVSGGASSRVLPVALALLALAVVAFVWFRRSQSRPPVLDPSFSISSDDVSAIVGVHPSGDGEAGISEEDTSVPR